MASTARMILMVEPVEKARWTADARKAGISTAEFLRRAAAVYDPELTPAEAEVAHLLIAEMQASVERMIARVDATLATVAAQDDDGRERQYRAKVMAELTANPPRLDFSQLRGLAA